MRMRNYLGLLALLISGWASAADYVWKTINGTFPTSSAIATCTAHASSLGGNTPTLQWLDPTSAWCNFKIGTGNNFVKVIRTGDSCPAGTTYNATTGACDAPFTDQGKPCPDQSGATADVPKIYDKGGQCVLLNAADQETTCKFYGHSSTTKPLKVKGTINDQGEAVPPPTVKDSGCAATVVASQCVVKPPKIVKSQYSEQPAVIPGGALCAVEVRYTGAVASTVTPENLQAAKDDVCLDPAKCNLPEPQQSTEKKPCTYVSAPDGSQTCVSTSGVTKEGKTQCGTVNGVLTCSDSMAKPIGNGMIVWTKVNSEGLGDGKTKVTKTDTMTSYTCGSGKSTCTSSTSTSTTVTIKDGSGNTESVTGSCTGSACPDKNGNPDGDGDGFGDCVGNDCAEDATIGGQDWYEKGDDTYSSVIGEFADGIKQTPVVSGLDNFLTVSVGGSCPVWQVSVWVFDIRLDQWCQSGIPWELIRAVVLACAAFLAFRIAYQ